MAPKTVPVRTPDGDRQRTAQLAGSSVVFDLAEWPVLVTGAGKGLGAHLVGAFLLAGARVVAHHRSPSPALGRMAEQEPRLRLIAGDLTDQQAAAGVVEAGFDDETFRVVVNNAGTYRAMPILDSHPGDFVQALEENAVTAYNCLHHASALMRAAGGGSIVNVGSLSASRTSGHQAGYDSAKAALVRLTKSAAAELACWNVRVNAVSPGLLARPELETEWPDGVRRWTQNCPMGRLGRHGDVANACLFLASEASSWITGQELVVDGGMSVAPPY